MKPRYVWDWEGRKWLHLGAAPSRAVLTWVRLCRDFAKGLNA